MTRLTPRPRWDIFCRVIDNYGDIGVCWRLARQLADEHGLAVRLWVDDLNSLQPLNPEIDAALAAQISHGVEVRHWTDDFSISDFAAIEVADVVIEAFACELPPSYQAAMAMREPKPVWLNLEYLSAEAWVDGCHGLPSPHPRLGLAKYFFFPGFMPATGGLLRERELLQQRDAWQAHAATARQALGLPAAASDEALVSLFCYDTAPIEDLLAAWQASASPVRCLLPQGKALARVAAYFKTAALGVGDVIARGSLSLHVLPFMPQQDYDRLLWSCDCNFVRGEDSFVRAQWAAKPMLWQIYPQQENAHRPKLDAFLDRYCIGLPADAAAVLRAFHHGWNGHGGLCWNDLLAHMPVLKAHAAAWARQLSAQTDLAAKLVIFCKNRV